MSICKSDAFSAELVKVHCFDLGFRVVTGYVTIAKIISKTEELWTESPEVPLRTESPPVPFTP